MRVLNTSNSFDFILVDDEDFERLSKFTWHLSNNRSVYRSTSKYTGKRLYRKGITISLANEVMNTNDIMYDHKDRNSFNNSRLNLRLTNNCLNQGNRSKTIKECSSKYKGVYFFRNKWAGRITRLGRKIFLGYYDTQELAASAYNKKAIEIFGEHACLNKNEEGIIL